MRHRAVPALCLAVLLALPVPGWSQPVLATGRGLKIAVIQGEGAVNTITRNAAPVVVEVRDEEDKPVPRAEVVFQLPFAGPSGTFYGWLRTHTTRSDEQGRAASAPFTPSSEEGAFDIVVTASEAGRRGTVRIRQSNSHNGAAPAAKKSHKTVWIVLGVIAAGAIGGGVAASRGGGSTTTVVSIPVTITPGVVAVGGPR